MAFDSSLTFYCGDFPSMALFIPIMAAANESIDSWVSTRGMRIDYQSPTTYFSPLSQDHTRGPPLPLASLKSTTDNSNLTSIMTYQHLGAP